MGYAQGSIILESLRAAWFDNKKASHGVVFEKYFNPVKLETMALIFTIVSPFLFVFFSSLILHHRLNMALKNGPLGNWRRRQCQRSRSRQCISPSATPCRSGLHRMRSLSEDCAQNFTNVLGEPQAALSLVFRD